MKNVKKTVTSTVVAVLVGACSIACAALPEEEPLGQDEPLGQNEGALATTTKPPGAPPVGTTVRPPPYVRVLPPVSSKYFGQYCFDVNPEATTINLSLPVESQKASSNGCDAPVVEKASPTCAGLSILIHCPSYAQAQNLVAQLQGAATQGRWNNPRFYTPDGVCPAGDTRCQSGAIVCDSVIPKPSSGVYVVGDAALHCTFSSCPGGCMGKRW